MTAPSNAAPSTDTDPPGAPAAAADAQASMEPDAEPDTGQTTKGNPDGAEPRELTVYEVMKAPARREVRRLPKLVWKALTLVWEAAPGQLALSVVLQLAGALSLAAQLLVARRLLDGLLAETGASLAALAPELLAFVVLLLVVWLAGVARAEQQRVLSELVERHTTGKVMDVSTTVGLLDYDRPDFYDRLQRARVNAALRPTQMTTGILGLLHAGFAVAAIGATLIWIEPLVLVIVGLGYIPTWYVNRIGARALHAHSVRHTPGDRRRSYLYDVLTRKNEAHEVRAFDASGVLRAEHDARYEERITDLRRVARKRLVLGLAGGVFSAVVIGGALALLVGFVATGRLDLPAAAAAVGAVVLIAGRLRGLANSTGTLYEASLFLEDFANFIESNRPEPRATTTLAPPAERFTDVELDRVSFTYPSRTEPSLQDVSLRFRKGEVVALVGENGSGKTTLAKILAGLYHPTSGSVRWDGVDLRDWDPDLVRDNVAVIFQDYARYFLTARENVGIGQPSRIRDQAAVEEAARRAGAHGFLSSLPHGYETQLGPAFTGGSDLSGGQWQRVALARAYFRDAPLLILDEPTASLDPRGEYEIFEQVRRLAEGRTVILISHRFSSARSADRVLVLEGGRLTEEGPHDDLMARGGLYAELFSMQAASYR